MTLRVLNVNNGLDLRTGGGQAERTVQMSKHLARAGVSCEILAIEAQANSETRLESLGSVKVSMLGSVFKRFSVPTFEWRRIRSIVREVDVIHLMGHWSILNAMVYVAARQLQKPYVVCPAGALPLFGRSRFLKQLYNYLIGYSIIRNAAGWIAVTKDETLQFERYNVPVTDVIIIPNGVDPSDYPEGDISAFRKKHNLIGKRIILFFGRLNPIKGPDMLLEAFIQVRRELSEFHLVFVGPDGGMLSSLQQLAKSEGVADRVHFLGFVDECEKPAAYRSAELLVVPSRQEAMSIVAIEAGICGVPVLLTDQCGFSTVLEVDPRLEVPATAEAISVGLLGLLAPTDGLEQLSGDFSKFVLDRYTWNALIPQYLEMYNRLVEIK